MTDPRDRRGRPGAALSARSVGLPDEPRRPEQLLPRGSEGQTDFTLRVGAPVVVARPGSRDALPPRRRGWSTWGCAAPSACRSGVHGRPFGVLAAGSRRADDFSDEDVHFLEGMANTLAAAIERERRRRARGARRLEEALQAPRTRRASASWPTRRRCSSGPRTPTGMIDFINRGWLDFTGRADGGGARRHLGPGRAPRRRRGRAGPRWWRAFRRRVPWEREYRLRRHDGEYRWIVDRGVPRFEGDRLVGYVGTATDIHERKEMEEKLSEALPARPRGGGDPPALAAAREPARDRRGASWRRATCPPAAAPRSAATGTTRSSWRTAGWRWWWATWSATACAPRR